MSVYKTFSFSQNSFRIEAGKCRGEGDEVKRSVGIGAGSPEQPGEAAQSGGYPELGRLRHAVRGPQPVRHSPVGPGPPLEPLGESSWGRAPAGELLRESSWGSALARRPVLPPFTVATYHRVFKDLDVDAFEAVLGEWLINSGSGPGETLSLDGKTLGGIHGEGIPGVQLVSAYGARSGAVLTQVAAPGKGQELAAAKAVLDQAPLAGRVVVADALLTQREVCWQMVDGGGDYRLPVKERQPTLYRDLAEAFSPTGS